MSASLWSMNKPALRCAIISMDRRFQRAMRRELGIKARKPAKPAVETAQQKLDRVRDVLVIPSFVGLPAATAWQGIVADVCLKYMVSKQELTGEGRTHHIVLARQEAMYRMRKETTMSTPSIAKRLGRADHTTVLYGIRKHQARMAAQ